VEDLTLNGDFMILPDTTAKILLSFGIFASLLFLLTDLLAGKLVKGYSFVTQSMSELGAAGSPTRPLVVALTIVASIFMIAFGVGIWQVVGAAPLPQIVAGLIVGNAFLGLIGTLFFPNHIGVRPQFATPPVLIMFFSVLCFVFAMVFGVVAFEGWMRGFSIAIPVAYVVLAIFRFATASSSKAGGEGLIGIQERTMSFSYLAWVICLAIYLQ
jgi:hypothetical protein